MNKGFIFDPLKCVRCNACSAACILENDMKARRIYTWNEDAIAGLPVYNFSLACNHCENPSCLKACPAGCYSRDKVTGAILLNQEKCLGCKYCAWNCPYKAPRFNRGKRVIEKCHLCYSAVSAGDMPSCVNACPTGALGYGELSSRTAAPEWFPVEGFNPAIRFSTSAEEKIRTVPENKFESVPENKASMRWKNSDTSLAVFTFLATILVSIVSAALIREGLPNKLPIVLLSFTAAIISLVHLGKPLRAWRSLSNLRSSPLSLEILLFIIVSGLSISGVYSEIPALLISASVSGLILLLIIDHVYNHVSSRSWLHSGQTFLTSLLLVSYLAGSMVPFTFIVMIKLILSGLLLVKKREMFPAVRYLRIAVLFLVWAGLISGFNRPDTAMLTILLIGEVADRFLFYSDFEPGNIRNMIKTNLKHYINEEKRG